MADRPERFPSPDEESDPERRAIRAAMNRLLGGAPLRLAADSRPTVVNLAAEADVKRVALTHRHTDLKDEFYARVAASERDEHSQSELELMEALQAAEARAEAYREERNKWQAAVHDLARVVQALELELKAQTDRADALQRRLRP